MKRIFFILLLIFIFHSVCQWDMDSIIEYNREVVSSPDFINNTFKPMVPNQYSDGRFTSAAVKIIGFDGKVNNGVFLEKNASLLWGWYATAVYKYCYISSMCPISPITFPECEDAICVQDLSPGSDVCPDVETWKNYSIETKIDFSFGNTTKTVITNKKDEFIIEIPFSPQEINLSENKTKIRINLTTTITLAYEYKKAIASEFGECVDGGTTEKHYSATLKDSTEVEVYKGEKEYILVRPILKEQWFRNNRFDNVILSNEPLVCYRVEKDGEGIKNEYLTDYQIKQNSFGIKEVEILSLSPYCKEKWNIGFKTFPKKYRYFCEINCSYNGTGKHELEISSVGFLGEETKRTHEILSTILTFKENKTELGKEKKDIPNGAFRESKVYKKEKIHLMLLPASMIAILIIFAMLNKNR